MTANSRKLFLSTAGCILAAAAAFSSGSSPAYKPTDKAFYASPEQVNFIRPGLVIKVVKVDIDAAGVVKAWVNFTDPKGAALDKDGIQSPGPITVSFLIAAIPADQRQFISYITRQRTGGGRTVEQATGENTGSWQTLDIGQYVYTFANRAPSGFDRNATHRVAVYGSRNLTDYEFPISRADAWLDFVPAGAAVSKVRDIVRTSSCNKCHDQLALHGGNRRSVEVCVVCHQPQTTEPVTNNTVDMPVMIHKIHMGASLPSVVAKGKYMIGNADYSTVVNPAPVMACGVCHEPKSVSGAAQADAWLTNPNRAACGACHDDVNFNTGAKHAAGAQFSDNQCANCHIPKGESDFDASIQGAHVVPADSSLLGGVRFTIQSAEDVAPGKHPTVTFTVRDKQGNPIPLNKMGSTRLYMAGPTKDIPSYVREDVITAQGPGDGRYFWTFAAALPENASGTWQFGIEGYQNATILAGTTKERTIRDFGANQVFYAGINGSKAEPRRKVVSTAKCNQCHVSISFHGGNRNRVEMCSFCHNPTLQADGESFNLTNMIHRFHKEARFPGNLNNCAMCHENNSQNLPLQDGLMMVANAKAPVNPAPPTTNACTSCHDERQAWQHSVANTTRLGESCSVCHGANSDFAVSKVHAQ